MEKGLGDLVDLCRPPRRRAERPERRYVRESYEYTRARINPGGHVSLCSRRRRLFCVLQPLASVLHREQHRQRREGRLQGRRLGKLNAQFECAKMQVFFSPKLPFFIFDLFSPRYSAAVPASFEQQEQQECTYFIITCCKDFIYFICRSTQMPGVKGYYCCTEVFVHNRPSE